MAGVSEADVEEALKKRREYIVANVNTLSLKQCRKLLEKDLGLPENGLNEHKEFVANLVEQVVLSAQSDQAEEAAVQAKKDVTKSKPAAKEIGASGGRKPKRKDPGSEDDATGDEGKSRKKVKAGRKDATRKGKGSKKGGGSEEEEEEDDEEAESDEDSEADSEDSDAPKKRGVKNVKKGAKTAPAAKAERSAAAQKMQKVLRQATIPIPPAIYRSNPSNAQLEGALEDLLRNHGLNRNSEAKQIDKVKRKLQLSRDLEGIDTSNILEESGRGSRRAATRGVNYAAQLAIPKGSDDEEDEEEEEEEDDESDEASLGAASDVEDDDGGGDDEVEDANSEDEEEVVRAKPSSRQAAKSGTKQKAKAAKDRGGPKKVVAQRAPSASSDEDGTASAVESEEDAAGGSLHARKKPPPSNNTPNGKGRPTPAAKQTSDDSGGGGIAPKRKLAAWSDDDD